MLKHALYGKEDAPLWLDKFSAFSGLKEGRGFS